MYAAAMPQITAQSMSSAMQRVIIFTSCSCWQAGGSAMVACVVTGLELLVCHDYTSLIRKDFKLRRKPSGKSQHHESKEVPSLLSPLPGGSIVRGSTCRPVCLATTETPARYCRRACCGHRLRWRIRNCRVRYPPTCRQTLPKRLVGFSRAASSCFW